jgi:hypothetical protein
LPAEGLRIIGVGVDKNRRGRVGEVAFAFHGDTQTWTQSTVDVRCALPARGNGDDL